MKKLDIKSALIGVFFTTTVIFSMGQGLKVSSPTKEGASPVAVPVKETWDNGQLWELKWLPSAYAPGNKTTNINPACGQTM